MKQLIEAIKAARKQEIILILLAVCALFLCSADSLPSREMATEEELRIQRILSQIEGAGPVCVMLSSDANGVPVGAIIAAPGAERIEVQLKLLQAVHTLTGLELEQIEIVKSKR